MRRALSIGLLILLLLGSVPMVSESAPQDSWTIMIYMGGGYESGISDAIPYDLSEISRAGYHQGFNILVLKDGDSYGDTECMVLGENGFSDIPLNEMDPSLSPGTSELDLSSPHTLSSFVGWGLDEYPASHSMLVMWGHGRGWMGMPNDENGVMDMPGFSLALKQITRVHGKLDVIGFDQCNMAMFEVFYEIAPYSQYAVASEKEEDIAGWPYDLWLSHIYSMENPDGRNVSMQVVRDYVSWATENSDYSATMSAVNLSRMDAVGDALREYSMDLRFMLPYHKEELTRARYLAEHYDRLPYPYDLVNLTSSVENFLDFMPLNLAASSLVSSVDSAVILEMHHTIASDMSVRNAHGIGIWFPSYGSTDAYEEIRAEDTGWWIFLDLYLSSVPGNMPGLNTSITELDGNDDGASEAFVAHADTDSENLTVKIEVYSQGGELLREAEGKGSAELRFQWSAGYFNVLSYVLNGSSVAAYGTDEAVIESLITINGFVMDFMDRPVRTEVEVLTPHGEFRGNSSEDGSFSVVLTAPYMFMPGEKAELKVCAGAVCDEREIWLNGSALQENFRLSPYAPWQAYAAGLAVMGIGFLGFILLFDPGRKRERMKNFKKVRKLKRTKKVMWVKDITDRRTELEELSNALGNAKKGEGSTIFLTGEEGIGKRTLMEKFRQDSGVKSVFYECKGSSVAEPYESVRKIVDMLDSMGLVSGDGPFSSKGGKEQLFEFVFQTFRAASSEDAILISVFSAQWLDPGSIEMLGYLARGISDTRILLVISAPQEELEDIDGRPHPLNAMFMELIMEGKVRMLKLDRFGPEETREMLSNILGTDIPDESLQKIYEMTRGLPAMISEVAMTIRKAGLDVRDPDSLDIEVPSTVKALVSRRISRIGESERAVAEWAAVLGESFSYEDIKELAGEEGLGSSLYSLIEDRILVEEGGNYHFDHPEIRKGILESLGERAKEMHLRAGELLEKKGSSVYELAYQFCTGGDRERCLKYSILAAEDAESSYAPRKAVEHYKMALSVADDDEVPEICIRMSMNYHKTMDVERAIECAEKVIYSEADARHKEKAHALLGVYYLESSMWDEALEEYAKILDSEDPAMKVEGYRGTGKVYWRTGRHAEARENIEKALEIAEGMDDLSLIGSIQTDLANVLYDLGKYDEAERLYKEAISTQEKSGNLVELARTYNNLGEIYRYRGDVEKAIECYEKCIEYGEKSNHINHIGYGVENIGTVYASTGRLDEAKEYLDRAYRIFNKTGNKYMISGIHMAYGIIYSQEGDWDEAEKNFLVSIDMLKDIDIKYDLGVSYLEYARMLAKKGDSRAENIYEKARKVFQEIGSEEQIRKIEKELNDLDRK